MKKKLFTAFLSLICVLAAAFGLTACNDSENITPNVPKVTYTVTFATNGGSAVSAQTVNDGEKASRPEAPTKDGYDFVGWYSDSGLTTVYDFDSAVKEDITVYAKWQETEDENAPVYTVTFDTNGGSEISDVTVKEGKTITAPEEPTKDGYYFVGWYSDIDLTESYDFDTEINEDITVYAKWSEYVIYAVDQYGNPVEGVWLGIGYITSDDFSFKQVAYAETDETGRAVFDEFESVEGVTDYYARLADLSNSYTVAVPEGYTLDLGDDPSTGFAISELKFGEDRKLTFTFRQRFNDFYSSERTYLGYKRQYDFTTEKITETSAASTSTLFSVKDGIYSYFVFKPYVEFTRVSTDDINPATGKVYTQDEVNTENDRRIALSKQAASGKYEITFTSSSGNVTLYYYNGSTSFISVDENGIPQIINSFVGAYPEVLPTGASYDLYIANTTTITLDISEEVANGDYVFGIFASENCTVTVSVKRTGDATPVPENVLETYEPQCELVEFTDQTGTLTEIPVSATWKIVYNETDGYYHVNGANGPLLVVALDRHLGRVTDGNLTISNLHHSTDGVINNPFGEAIYYFVYKYDENGNPTNSYDFGEMIDTYTPLCNSDGVYPVNEDLKLFLSFYGDKCFTASPDAELRKLNWLIPCMYYAPEGGFVAEGAGTSANPYVLNECLNAVDLSSGTNYLSFTASSDAIYKFELSAGTLSVVSEAECNVSGGAYYISVKKDTTIELTLTGASGSNTINISAIDKLSAVVAETSQGTSEETAIKINLAELTTSYEVDTSVCEDGVYVYYTLLGAGQYVFDLGDSTTARIIYDGQTYTGNQLVLTVEKQVKYNLLLTATEDGEVVDGIYFLHIYKQV